ncbi:IS3 family transposase [Synechococcus sp. BSF8S]|uniref:IS3 family transposase n=1 Tax=unclassified Synechococcus TaxID=2626047 RepID=UPI00351C3897
MFREHRGFYGSPRIHQELRAAGHPIGRHRVARLMRRADLRARTRKPFRPCSKGSGGAAGVVENLLQQEFAPPAPNRCWAGDITYSQPCNRCCIDRLNLPSTGPPTTAICSESRRSAAACPPKDAAGTTPWWRASSPPSSWS